MVQSWERRYEYFDIFIEDVFKSFYLCPTNDIKDIYFNFSKDE